MATTIAENNYVIVNDGLVISVFKGVDLPEYNEEMTEVIDVTDATPTPELGWSYNQGEFTAPVFLELTGKDKLKFDRGQNLIKPIFYIGHDFDVNSVTYLTIIGYQTYLNTFGTLPEGFVWTDVNDEEVPMTSDQFKEFFKIAIERVLTEHLNYIDAKKQL